MVQVDVFWSYGIGAGLGLASAPGTGSRVRDLVKEGPAFHALLFLAIVLAPSGFVSLWSNPSWQTMHAGTRELPAWLVALFGITNITQGLLGFWVARRLYERGRPFAAYLQWVLGYFFFYFVLVHGWDGTGYRRFFSPTRESLAGWTWTTVLTWLTSDVALLLLVMLAVMVPWLLGLTVPWLRAGARARGLTPAGPAEVPEPAASSPGRVPFSQRAFEWLRPPRIWVPAAAAVLIAVLLARPAGFFGDGDHTVRMRGSEVAPVALAPMGDLTSPPERFVWRGSPNAANGWPWPRAAPGAWWRSS